MRYQNYLIGFQQPFGNESPCSDGTETPESKLYIDASKSKVHVGDIPSEVMEVCPVSKSVEEKAKEYIKEHIPFGHTISTADMFQAVQKEAFRAGYTKGVKDAESREREAFEAGRECYNPNEGDILFTFSNFEEWKNKE